MSDRLLTSDAALIDQDTVWRDRLAAIRLVVRTAWRRRATRKQIVRLDAHALKDIGVSYADAEAEANKPFWRG